MQDFTRHPMDGGSYRQNADGTFSQLEPTTGERPCKCRPEEHALADPPAAARESAPSTGNDDGETPSKSPKARRYT